MKLLIVRSSQKSTWGSCQVISPNLQQTYNNLPDSFKVSWFDLPADFLEQEIDSELNSIHSLSEKIIAEKPDQLIFVDHLPNPAEILSRLLMIMNQKQIPAVSIHIYGDFTYFSKDWMDLSSKLVNHPIRFITASLSQKKLIDFFCEETENTSQFCFPVNSDDYYYDHNARIEIRKELKIADNDIVLLYAGRVSLQKNVDLLLQEYLELLKKEDINVHLWIAGSFDDIGAPFMGLETSEGYLYSKIQTILNQYPKHFTKNVKIWGHLNKTELRRLNSAADLFASFSLYHDEDFGMSPAEALACGLPTLLTDWGGYSSFVSTKWRCKLAPVRISEYGLEVKTSALRDFYELYKQTYIGQADRERWANEFSQIFSSKAAVHALEAVLKTPTPVFKGFNWKLSPFAQIYSKQFRSKSIDPNTCPSSKNFYGQVYQNYISTSDVSKDHYKVVNWTYDYILNSQQDPALPVGRKIRPNHYYLRPFSLPYYGPHNPVLIGGYLTKKLLNKKSWSLRDGLVPLSFFFKEHTPEPGVVYNIPSEFWYVVPENWKKQVSTYEIKSQLTFGLSRPPERILLAGMQDSVFADINEFKNCLAELAQKIGSNHLTKAKITALFPYKRNNLWGKRSDDETFSMAQALLKETGFNVHFIEWNELKIETSLKDCLYFEVNKHYFIADSYLKFFALSRGAGLLESSKTIPSEETGRMDLSPNHFVVLSSPDWKALPTYSDPFQHHYFSYFQDLVKGQLKSVRISPNWESWYPLYLKKFYKLFPPKMDK